MLSKQFIGIVVLSCSLFFFSCNNEEKYTGEDVMNYPDLNKVLNDSWDMEAPYVYLKVSKEGKKVDSTQVQSTSMPWDEIKSMFDKADIHKDELNHHYAIDLMKDSMSGTTTLYYKSLAPKDYSRTLNIISDSSNNELTSVYFETAEGDSKISKVLYLPKKLIQIQERNKVDGNNKIKVETYYFPE